MEPQRFKSRPAEIEAMQWDGTRESIKAICAWANSFPQAPNPDRPDEEIDPSDPHVTYVFITDDDVYDVQIDTFSGPVPLEANEWVIRGVSGEFYPCAPSVFAERWEAV